MNQNDINASNFSQVHSAAVVVAVATADKGDCNNEFNDYGNIVSQIKC